VVMHCYRLRGIMGTKRGPSWVDEVKIRIKRALGMNIILCDSCKWDWRSACHHPERPNAVWCPDWEKKGT
jgi:hypothetical protein